MAKQNFNKGIFAAHLKSLDEDLLEVAPGGFPENIVLTQIRLSLNDKNLAQKAQEARQHLATLKKRLAIQARIEKVVALQKHIRCTLMFLAEHFPANQKDDNGHLLCPLTKKQLEPGNVITLSNGYSYDKKALRKHTAWQSAVPALLPESTIEIDKQDVKNLHTPVKKIRLSQNLIYGFLGSCAAGLTFTLLHVFGIATLSGAATGIALGLGVTAGIGLGLAIGSGIGLIALPLAITAIATAIYIKKKYPLELSASPSITAPQEKAAFKTGTILKSIGSEPRSNPRKPTAPLPVPVAKPEGEKEARKIVISTPSSSPSSPAHSTSISFRKGTPSISLAS